MASGEWRDAGAFGFNTEFTEGGTEGTEKKLDGEGGLKGRDGRGRELARIITKYIRKVKISQAINKSL